jgi:hypothetical protein
MNDTAILYRVENHLQVGPYSFSLSGINLPPPEWAMRPGKGWNAHPSPNSDGIPNLSRMEKFAFETIHQFFDWYGHPIGIHNLVGNGFHVSRLSVQKSVVRYGQRQVVFQESGVLDRETLNWDRLILELNRYALEKEE